MISDLLKKFSKTKSLLGIYFGPQLISVVQSKDKSIVGQFQISRSQISSAQGTEENIPEEIKMTALFNEEFRKNDITENKISLAISGRDVIIRTFEIPLIPREELSNAINFEAKKHLPFKLEELVLDYQLIFDKKTKKNLVLVVAIKQEVINKYLAICDNLKLNVVSIEYSAFSALRLLKLASVKENGVIAVVNVDLKNEDEMSFIVLENGFPLFSRDIVSIGETQAQPEAEAPVVLDEKQGSAFSIDKFKSELRVSLDFFSRKFPTKKIGRIFFVAAEDYNSELESFVKEKDLSARFIELKNILGNISPLNLNLAKAFGSSLFSTVKSDFKINLLTAYHKLKARKETKEFALPFAMPQFEFKLKFKPKLAVIGALICFGVYAYTLFQINPVQKEISRIISIRQQSALVSGSAEYNSLATTKEDISKKESVIYGILDKKIFLVDYLNVIPRLLPKGLWLTNLSISKEGEKCAIAMQGFAFLGDRDKEMKEINNFLSKMIAEPKLKKTLKNLVIDNIVQVRIEDTIVTSFQISSRK